MNNSAVSQRTPALFILVFMILILASIVGLLSAGGPLMDRRSAQNAADTAALAAAICHMRGNKDCIQRAYDMAAQNGFNNDRVSNQVEVYTCDMAQSSCGPDAGKPDAFQAIITIYRETFLTKVVGIRQRERVQAMALVQPPARISLLHDQGRTERSLVFSVPPWLESIPDPYRLALLFLIGGLMMVVLPPLLRRRHV